jgi:drug/metabolite transporter (DMT)-like permease
MTPIAITLITISAFSHAYWNFLGKRSNPSPGFFLIANATAALLLSPLLIVYRQSVQIIPASVWALLLATGLFQTIYFTGLAQAYRRGDMSLAYPLARAVPVVLVALLNLGLGKGDQIGNWGMAGMALVTVGCLILPLPHFGQFRLQNYLTACGLFALVAAIGTTGYTLIDDTALRLLRTHPSLGLGNTQITLVFITLEATSISLIMGTYTLWRKSERQVLKEIWRKDRYYAAVTGLIILATYSLVLAAMAYVRNVSYVAAFRQFSIPLGAILGMTIQHEPRFPPKMMGIAIVSVGLMLVGVG